MLLVHIFKSCAGNLLGCVKMRRIMFRKTREPWQIAAARYCVDNSEKGFEFGDLKQFIKENYAVSDRHLEFFVQEEIQQPTGRQFSRQGDGGRWVPPLDLVSKINDYDELREARKNSKQAFWFSSVSVAISLIAMLITLFK